MKKITSIFVAIIAAGITTSYSQALDYNDLGILLSKRQPVNGSARFNAMAGAFGALGSDVSALEINPAGGAVARKSKASVTLQGRNISRDAFYYGNSNNIDDLQLELNQAGGIFVFDTNDGSGWDRFAFHINYQVNYDFNNSYLVEGNSNFLFYNEHLDDTSDPKNLFDRSLNQRYSVNTAGQNSSFNLGLSAVHDNKLHIGAAIKFHSLDYRENTLLNEVNDDINGNKLDVDELNERYISGFGSSISLGFIYKLNKYVRIGASYETPTWYTESLEETANTLTMYGIESLNFNTIRERDLEAYSLKFRSPGRLNASGALIFGKQGLISFDYTYQDFTNFKYQETDNVLQDANNFFDRDFRATHTLRAGTEWRFDKVSLRGGYFYEKNPNLREGGSTNIDNIRGYGAGIGYNFGNTQIDLSYSKFENTDFFSLYNFEDIQIGNNTSKISATVTFSL